MIGQFGLQVLNEEEDTIELAIFLGQAYSKAGIGTRLTQYAINRCHELGINNIFVVIRNSNIAGINAAKKFSLTEVKRTYHYGKKATIYKIDLH